MAKEMRTAMKVVPKNKSAKQNLIIALANQVEALVQQDPLQRSKPLLDEGRKLDASNKFINETTRFCGRR